MNLQIVSNYYGFENIKKLHISHSFKLYNSSINLEFDDNNILSSLFGINDSNIKILEKLNKVKIEYRGNKVKICRAILSRWHTHHPAFKVLTITANQGVY